MKIKAPFYRLHSYIFIFFSLLFISCSTPRLATQSFKESPAFSQGFAGLAVFGPQENKMIYEYNAEKYFTPASNVKLLTFYTGLKLLGDSVPALLYVVQNDSLLLMGTGDPSFLNPDLPESSVLKFLETRNEKLFYLQPSEEEKYFGPGWSWDDYNSYYSVERTSFPIYGNRVNFVLNSGKELEVFPKRFQDSLITQSNSPISSPGIKRDMTTNSFIYTPYTSSRDLDQNIPFKYSSELLVNLLRDTLGKEVRILREFDISGKQTKMLYSIPSDSLYKRMMEVSDNFIAEQILLMVSQQLTGEQKTDNAIDHMLKTHLADLPDAPKWVDGSGLSRYNLITPRSVIKLLLKIKEEVNEERLFNMLATGGKTGTLKNNYAAPVPYIFAKTGTLRNNHSLSGYLRAKSGKILLFSFMNNNYTVPTNDLKAQMEIILWDFYENN